MANTTFPILSWNRCEKHNQELGLNKNSSHIKGYAVDILTTNKERQWYTAFYLMLAGFTRLGIGEKYIHADCDPDKRPQKIWFY